MPRIHRQKDTLWLLIYLEGQTNSLDRLCGSGEAARRQKTSRLLRAFAISSQFGTHCPWDVLEQGRPEPALGQAAAALESVGPLSPVHAILTCPTVYREM